MAMAQHRGDCSGSFGGLVRVDYGQLWRSRWTTVHGRSVPNTAPARPRVKPAVFSFSPSRSSAFDAGRSLRRTTIIARCTLDRRERARHPAHVPRTSKRFARDDIARECHGRDAWRHPLRESGRGSRRTPRNAPGRNDPTQARGPALDLRRAVSRAETPAGTMGIHCLQRLIEIARALRLATKVMLTRRGGRRIERHGKQGLSDSFGAIKAAAGPSMCRTSMDCR